MTDTHDFAESVALDAPPAPASKGVQFAAGLKSGLPIFLGYVPVGLAFGILACQHGFYWWEALLASAGAIAGSGQFVALSALLASGGHVAAALIASSVVNLRYLLFSATMAPHVRKVKPPLLLGWLAFLLTDETFAINMAEIGEGKSTHIRQAGVGLSSWVGWVSGTMLGAIGATFVKNADRFGVNFAMPAMYAALFVALARNFKEVLCGLGSAFIVIALYVLKAQGVIAVPHYWFIVIAALLAATVATLIWPHADEKSGRRDLDADGQASMLESAAAADEMLVGTRVGA
ncbi:MAG: AzlC family ABC transporter permease [Actinomycetia bacterium]|nr:AzlC family ABC transporter permease [Actinomycetes bacterium]